MKIGGMQKLTLLDYPEKMACIVFTAGCNFRCPFCHNASLVTHIGEGEDEESVLAFLDKRKKILDGVVISGGEPLIYDIEPFVRKVRDIGYSVKLDTNGSFPEKLKELIGKGLIDYVAMDIKNSPDRYSLTAGVDVSLSAVRESVDLLLSGVVDYEFRTTLVKPFFDKGDIVKLGQWIAGAKRYFFQSYVDSGDVVSGTGLSAYSDAETEEFLAAVKELVPSAALRERR